MKNSVNVISTACQVVEFFARLTLVNIPSYILASYPEFDRICNVIYAYLTLQVAGFCWGFLINALFALACRIVSFIPPDMISSLSDSSVSFSSVESVATFYVAYASIRTVVGFGQSIFHLALESIKDFPEASTFLSNGGELTLQLYPIMFLPSLAVEVAFIASNTICSTGFSPPYAPIADGICNMTGTYFLTDSYPEVRRIVLYALVLNVVQIWQTYLHEFPRFDLALKRLSRNVRAVFQFALLGIIVSTLVTVSIILSVPATAEPGTIDTVIVMNLLGWTIWLFAFSPVLFETHGSHWALQVSQQSIESLAAYIRLSQIIFLAGLFAFVCFRSGFLIAQLDLTIITVILPMLYCSIYLLASAMMRATPFLIIVSVLLSVVGSAATTYTAQSGGKGGALLVFLHIFYKLLQVFGRDPVGGVQSRARNSSSDWVSPVEEEDDKDISISSVSVGNDIHSNSSHSLVAGSVGTPASNRRMKSDFTPTTPATNPITPTKVKWNASESSTPSVATTASPMQRTKSMHTLSNPSSDKNNQDSEREIKHRLARRHSHGSNMNRMGGGEEDKSWFRNSSIQAEKLLAARDDVHSTHVSLGLSTQVVRKHWIIRLSRRYVRFLIAMIRRVTVSSSALVGISRIFILLAVCLAISLAAISVASHMQMTWNLFPKLIDLNVDQSSGEMQFDHRIVNVTLYPSKSSKAARNLASSRINFISENAENCGGDGDSVGETCPRNDRESYSSFFAKGISQRMDSSDKGPPLLSPSYAACGWNMGGLSLLDFALLSEMAYFDDYGDEKLQQFVDNLFPQFDFQVTLKRPAPTLPQGAKPMYLEVTSEALNLAVIAIRGTDVGRLQDLMEDVKLYAEPVIFTLLSGVFPTIRLWSHDTTSRVIEWLYEFNTFFGLQGESEYYRPLTERVFELATASSSPAHLNQVRQVVLTGHSLGGGLARIVGTLTEQPSVTFSPPGLALSYRKYSTVRPDGSVVEVNSRGAVHHNSMAVITEYDWVPQVDHQVGLVQRILCDRDEKAHQMSCHLLEGTICHLLQHCGDVHNRFVSCDFNYDLSVAVPSIIKVFVQHRWFLMPPIVLFVLMIALAVLPEIL